MSGWQKKQAKAAEFAMEKELAEAGNNFSESLVAQDCREAAMGKGDEELFEKKLSKEEKKALAKAKRDAKKVVSIRRRDANVTEQTNAD
jgi:hypothetical protein